MSPKGLRGLENKPSEQTSIRKCIKAYATTIIVDLKITLRERTV